MNSKSQMPSLAELKLRFGWARRFCLQALQRYRRDPDFMSTIPSKPKPTLQLVHSTEDPTKE